MYRIKLLIFLIHSTLFPVMVLAFIITDGPGIFYLFLFLQSKEWWNGKGLIGRSDTRIFMDFDLGRNFRISKCR